MHQDLTLVAGIVATTALAIPWLIALNDILRRGDREFPALFRGSDDRMIWIAIVLLGNVIGSIAYYFMVMGPHPRRPR